jgi:MYXO-CTERM domain-containing protein
MLDLPEGEQNSTNFVWSSTPGLMGGFEISSEHFNYQDLGYWATPGNIFAYDFETNTSQIGRIVMDADEGRIIELFALDVSGWSNSSATSELRVFVDGEMAYQEVFAMTGQVDFANLEFEGISGSVIEIELENLVNVGIGLDNIFISSTAVPAPGALALLGVAGIVGGRRRRSA